MNTKVIMRRQFKAVSNALSKAILLSVFICGNVQANEPNANAPTAEASISASQSANEYEKDALRVMSLIDRAQRLRALLPGFIDESNHAMAEHNGALPSTYTLRLARSLAQANEMRDGLFDQALRHRGALYRVDNQLNDSERMAEIIIGMAAGITLYDNNKAMRDAFDSNPVLREKLNESYPELNLKGGFYDSSNMRAANPEYRKAMNDALQYFNDNKLAIEAQIPHSASGVQNLYGYIAQSPSLHKLSGANVFKEIVILPVKAAKSMVGLSGHGLERIKFRTSQTVGNTMGLVRWREGKLKNDVAVLQALLAQLQPGDILLEKTPFTLTDKSIPGHFGHAALYTGTAEQLRTLGAANIPLIQKNLANIEAGQVVVEALRNGVQLDTLQAFMNIDDVAILRPKYLSIEAKLDAVKLALGNLGKQYDFNFDVNTTETIVCSELIYIVYPQIDFVTKRVLGSFTITPDDVAMQAGDANSPLAVVLFAHDGQLVLDANHDETSHDENGLVLYKQLVKGNAPQGTPQAEPQDVPNSQSAQFKGFIQ